MQKKFFLTIIALLLFNSCYSQRVYAKKNLLESSRQELNTYLIRAEHTRQVGTNLSVAGFFVFIGGFILNTASLTGFFGTADTYALERIMLYGGPALVTTGLSFIVTGSVRMYRINKIIHSSIRNDNINMGMSSQYNHFSGKHYPGITLTLNF